MLGQYGEVIEVLVAIVDDIKDFVGIVFFPDDFPGERAYVAVGPLLNDIGNPQHLLRKHFREVNLIFNPIGILGETHILNVVHIVRMIVYQGHGAELVKTFNQQSLRIEVSEPERADYGFHSVLAAEFLHLLHKGTRNFLILNEVIPSETDFLVVPLLVGEFIHDGCNSACRLSVLVCKVKF